MRCFCSPTIGFLHVGIVQPKLDELVHDIVEHGGKFITRYPTHDGRTVLLR